MVGNFVYRDGLDIRSTLSPYNNFETFYLSFETVCDQNENQEVNRWKATGLLSLSSGWYEAWYESNRVIISIYPILIYHIIIEPPHGKTNKMACAHSDKSDQPVRPRSVIGIFAVCSLGSLGPIVSSCGQRRLWLDWADVQADLKALLGAHVILLVLSCVGSYNIISYFFRFVKQTMVAKSILLASFTCCFFVIEMTAAMFFTNSKENDYPRIGKRLLPLIRSPVALLSKRHKTWERDTRFDVPELSRRMANNIDDPLNFHGSEGIFVLLFSSAYVFCILLHISVEVKWLLTVTKWASSRENLSSGLRPGKTQTSLLSYRS